MSKPVSLSAEYVYTAPNWVFHWITGFLWDHLDDPVDQEDLRCQTLGDYIHLDELSERARFRLLQALKKELVPAAQVPRLPYGGAPPEGAKPLLEEVEPLASRAAAALTGAEAAGSGRPYRLPEVVVSDVYAWPMPFGLFDFVVGFLRARVGDDADLLRDGRVDLRRLDGPLRTTALRVLADEAEKAAPAALASMVVGTPGHHGGYWDHGRALNDVRALALIARQVQREEDAGGVLPGRTDHTWPARSSTSLRTRRIILDEDRLWTADPDVYQWVVRFLRTQPGVPSSVEKFADAPWLDLHSSFPDTARRQVLERLASDLPEAVRVGFMPAPAASADEARFSVGLLRTLALLAGDALAGPGRD